MSLSAPDGAAKLRMAAGGARQRRKAAAVLPERAWQRGRRPSPLSHPRSACGAGS